MQHLLDSWPHSAATSRRGRGALQLHIVPRFHDTSTGSFYSNVSSFNLSTGDSRKTVFSLSFSSASMTMIPQHGNERTITLVSRRRSMKDSRHSRSVHQLVENSDFSFCLDNEVLVLTSILVSPIISKLKQVDSSRLLQYLNPSRK